jgi:hypothetical protein
MSYRHPQTPIASPGSSLEVVVYQDSAGVSPDVSLAPARPNQGSPYTGVTVAFKLDQEVTFLQKWGPTPTTADSNMVTINGASAAGETAAANVFFTRLVWLQPGRNRLSIQAGGTGPTAANIAVELYSGPMPFVGTV